MFCLKGLRDGRLVDFDTPTNLLGKETSVLNDFLNEKTEQEQEQFNIVANQKRKFSTDHF